MIDIPFRSFVGKCALEQSKMDGFIGDGIRGTPHVEKLDMIGGIFTRKAFERGNVGGELG